MALNPLCLVTGGAQGIGLGITRRLLSDGWNLAVLDDDREALVELEQQLALPRERLLTVRCDVTEEPAVKNAVAKALQNFERIDGLVNNAGIAEPESGPVEDLSLVDWQRWLDVDLTGPFLLAKHCVGHLRESRGAMVNIASTRALQSEPNCEAYAAAKSGLIGLTHALAMSLSGQVRVNAISPGWIATAGYAKSSASAQPQLSEVDHQQHPAGRVGRPEDVAGMCTFLLSEQAGFITGQNFVVDGGMTRKMVYAE